MKLTLWMCGLLLALFCGCQRPQSDFVHDPAGYLEPGARTRIATLHRALLRDGDIHFRLEILPTASRDINREAIHLFDAYRLGEATRAARGVLLLVDPVGEQVRLEIGSDLEETFPDGFVGYVEEQQLGPFLRSGRVGNGIEATVELLVARALDAEAFDPSTLPPRAPHLSTGGGARIDIAIGAGGQERHIQADAPASPPGQTPEETLKSYMEILARHVTTPDLALYTPATRELLAGWLVTPAQQQNELQRLEQGLGLQQILTSGDRAVIRFPLERRELPPYFMQRGENGWQLDLEPMGQYVGFNHKNQWHFRSMPSDYAFAFNDWTFDRHGFPHAR